MDFLKMVKENHLVDLFLNGQMGLEKEGLRVQLPADLGTTDHPAVFGDKEYHPYIITDYGESMPELITPPLAPYSTAHNFLQALNYILITNLEENEYMWPFSVPCQTSADENEIKISQTSNEELNKYRLYTAAKYGRKRQLINGIHINYSFNRQFLEKIFEQQEEYTVFEKFTDELYLKLASNFLRYQWLIVYLFGATPLAEDNFFESPFFAGKKIPTQPMRSLRNSHYGFINRPEIGVRYDLITHYVNDLTSAVETGLLAAEREFYGDIRLRGVVKDASSLLDCGIQYIEIRSFDNNPYHQSGLDVSRLQFVHLFFLTMVSIQEKANSKATEKGKRLKKIVAEEHPHAQTIQYEEGLWLLDEMCKVIERLELESDYATALNKAQDLLSHPERTIAGRILTDIENGVPLLTLGEKLGWQHKIETINKQKLPGFEYLSQEDQQTLYRILLEGADVPSWAFQKNDLNNKK